jgi:EAL domain-containing protein (putative c-di-GMP-specific phosphodiesterase class I)
VSVFSPEMEEGGADRFEIEQRLRVALAHDEFLLHFQPQIRVSDGKLSGVEALLRWRQNDLGVVSPAVFIPIAEETGLIGAIGEWVLQESGRQGARWIQDFRPVRIGVNVSAVQFGAPDFVASVVACLERTGLPPELLELEITESLVLADLNRTIRNLRYLREQGILLALDDFGTGQSSLAYLRDLPVDRVKIDRAFLREIRPGAPPGMLAHIIGMVHDLGLAVITEGIETIDQLEVLRELGCEEVQGFLCGKPMPASDLPQWLVMAGRRANGNES